MLRSIKAGFFRLSPGHYSSHRWYGHYKEWVLPRALKVPFAGQQQLPHGHGRWLDERLVEYPWLLSRLPDSPGDLLDAGSTLNHRLILSHPRLRNKNISIVTLAPEADCFWQQRISYVFGDIRNLYFRDSSFDTVVCLSVLEHVGLDNRMYDPRNDPAKRNPESYFIALHELRRVLKPGGSCFISIPFGKYQLRSWLQVFDEVMVDRVIRAFEPADYNLSYFRYADSEGWQRCGEHEAAGAPYFDLHADVPWPGCPAGAGAVACVELRK